MLKVTLKTGVIGATERQKQTVLGLGLKYREASRTLKDTPAIRGMIQKVAHLVSIVKEEEKKPSLHLVPEYELGAVTEQKKPVKKVTPKKETEEGKEATSKKETHPTKAKAKSVKKGHAAKAHKGSAKKSGGKGKKS